MLQFLVVYQHAGKLRYINNRCRREQSRKLPIKEHCITTSPSGSPAGFEPRACSAASTGRLLALSAAALGERCTINPFSFVLLSYWRWGRRSFSPK